MISHGYIKDVTELSSVSGGGYIATSWMALLNAYVARQDSEASSPAAIGAGATNPPLLTTATAAADYGSTTASVDGGRRRPKVPPPRLGFAYLNATHYNVANFIEGWSVRVFQDALVTLWTVVGLLVSNFMTYLPQGIVFAEAYAFLGSDAVFGRGTFATGSESTTFGFVGAGVVMVLLYAVYWAINKCRQKNVEKRAEDEAGSRWGGNGPVGPSTRDPTRLRYPSPAGRVSPFAPALTAASIFVFSVWLTGFVGYGLVCLQGAVTGGPLQGWVPTLTVGCALVFFVILYLLQKLVFKSYGALQMVAANGPIMVFIGLVIAYRMNSAQQGLLRLFERGDDGQAWSDGFLVWCTVFLAVAYPFVVIYKYSALPTFNQWRLRRAFYPAKAYAKAVGSSIAGAAKALTASNQPSCRCWRRCRRRPGFLAYCGTSSMCEWLCGCLPFVVDPKVDELNYRKKRLPKYTCMVAMHDWQRVDAPRPRGEETYTTGLISYDGLRRVDCAYNPYWNKSLPWPSSDAPESDPRVPMAPAVPLGLDGMTASRAMAISAAALAVDVGIQAGEATNKAKSVLIMSGITMGFWQTRNDGLQVIFAFLVWALAIVWLALTPFYGSLMGFITMLTWLVYSAGHAFISASGTGQLPKAVARFSLIRQIRQLAGVQRYTADEKPSTTNLKELTGATGAGGPLEVDAVNVGPAALYLTDGGHSCNLSLTAQLLPDAIMKPSGGSGPGEKWRVALPTGKRILQWDGGGYDAKDLKSYNSQLLRAVKLAMRYYGCRVVPVPPVNTSARAGLAEIVVPDYEAFAYRAEDTARQNYDKFKRYMRTVFRLDESKVDDFDRPSCMMFEVLYPGQSPSAGTGAGGYGVDANLVLYMCPRVRGMVNMMPLNPLPPMTGEDAKARDDHFDLCHSGSNDPLDSGKGCCRRNISLPPVARTKADMKTAINKTMPNTYGCCSKCCNRKACHCAKLLGDFPNVSTFINQFFYPALFDTYHRAGYNAMDEAEFYYPEFFKLG